MQLSTGSYAALVRNLSPDDSGPTHTRIASALRDAINDGEFQPGQPIPSRAELVKHFGVANATVHRAVSTLQAEGLLVGRHGSGVFVRVHREPQPVTEDDSVYLVVQDQGGIFGAYLDGERADQAAQAIGGVIAALPILLDYRTPPGNGQTTDTEETDRG